MSWLSRNYVFLDTHIKKSKSPSSSPRKRKRTPRPPNPEWLPGAYRLVSGPSKSRKTIPKMIQVTGSSERISTLPLVHPSSPAYEQVWFPRNTNLVREGLVVKQTWITKGKNQQRLPFKGLFTMVDLPQGAFLGLYAGRFYEENDDSDDDETGDDAHPPSHYAVNLSGFVVIPPSTSSSSEIIDPETYPMAMMNEPPLGDRANVGIVEWLLAKDAVPGIRPNAKVLVAAIHACRPIHAGEEIYFYYGDKYDRRHYGRKPYNVGKGCESISRGNVPASEHPRRFFEDREVYTLPEGEAYLALSS